STNLHKFAFEVHCWNPVTHCQRHQFAACAAKERIVDDQKSAGASLQQACKCSIDLICIACIYDFNSQVEDSACLLNLLQSEFGIRVIGIHQGGDPCRGGKLAQQFKTLRGQHTCERGDPGQITARPVKASDEVLCDRIAAHEEDNWNGGGRRLRRVCRVNPGRYNHCDSALNQIGGERGQSIIVTVRPAVFDGYIAPLVIPGFGEALPEPVHPLGRIAGRNSAEESDYRRRRLLRIRRERPRRRSAEQRDELAARSHSITSSASASNLSGTSRPSAFAVLRLTTSSYFVGACTGKSAGFSPLRMRST